MDFPAFRLDGRVAMVTGAGQGIGRAIALGFAHAGATVVVTDHNEATLRSVADELAGPGKGAMSIPLDVAAAEAITRAVRDVLTRYGRIDILVNNAGVRVHKPVLDHTLEDWEHVFRVNCTGVFLLSQAVAAVMREGNGGAIINISSQMAFVTSPDRVAYCASKAAVNQMTRVMAVDWARYNIRVNAIGPGPITTPFTESATANGAMPVTPQMVPLGRMGDPTDIAAAAVYLASDAAKFVTGTFLLVDGGQSVLWR